MTDLPVTSWEALQDADPLEDTHADWLDHREHTEVEHRDRLERFASSYVACVLCGEREGKPVFGCHCQQCFEARRAEREEAA